MSTSPSIDRRLRAHQEIVSRRGGPWRWPAGASTSPSRRHPRRRRDGALALGEYPLGEATLTECLTLARRVGHRLWCRRRRGPVRAQCPAARCRPDHSPSRSATSAIPTARRSRRGTETSSHARSAPDAVETVFTQTARAGIDCPRPANEDPTAETRPPRPDRPDPTAQTRYEPSHRDLPGRRLGRRLAQSRTRTPRLRTPSCWSEMALSMSPSG
jgi:hypothetical protein